MSSKFTGQLSQNVIEYRYHGCIPQYQNVKSAHTHTRKTILTSFNPVWDVKLCSLNEKSDHVFTSHKICEAPRTWDMCAMRLGFTLEDILKNQLPHSVLS